MRLSWDTNWDLSEDSDSDSGDEEDESNMLLLMATLENEEPAQKRNNWRDSLNEAGRLRRDRRIPRESLLMPKLSAWQHLYSVKNNQAFIT